MQYPLKAFVNGVIYSKYEIYKQHALLVDNNRIVGIVSESEIPTNYYKINVEGANISAGLIDLQIYGGGGILFSENPSLASLDRITKSIVESGTTSYYLTLATNTPEIFLKAIEIESKYMHPALMGIHFEGPFLNPDKKGAHIESCIHSATLTEIKELIIQSKGRLKMMTLAPEVNSEEVVKCLLEAGVILSAGHSNATFEQATLGFSWGIQTVTHLFNAMSSLHHRNVGLPGAVFNHQSAMASIIADGIHVNYEAVKLAKKALGERLFYITDAVAPADNGPYIHQFKGDHYALPNGTLSGSALTQFQSVLNGVEHAGISLAESLRMATLYPAKLIKAEDLGHLSAGAQANIIVFKNQKIQKIYLQGELVESTLS